MWSTANMRGVPTTPSNSTSAEVCCAARGVCTYTHIASLGKVILGLDVALLTMNLGEVARFIIKPEYGYGVLGLAPKVEPNETLDYEIELVSFGAFVHIFYGKDEWEVLVSAEDKIRINNHKVPLYLNRALCKIKLNKWADAEWDCDKAIEINNTLPKAHFRRSLVFLGKLNDELAKEDRKEFWVIDKATKFLVEAETSLQRAVALTEGVDDAQIVKTQIDLKRAKLTLQKYIKNYHEAEKKLYKDNIMDRLVADNKKKQASELQHELEHAFEDMPSLE
ncbi:hypothetical protein DYB25_001083 [Aphanomyces astaci]|uniref:peptidylprolyl isomerase n=1 Tax=Aphanomyces astaci TaxID=112090 RepID=A0A397AWZ7_APHAT|nr:hypothetical protein DYB25_001083 [Aphanomyces astaci]